MEHVWSTICLDHPYLSGGSVHVFRTCSHRKLTGTTKNIYGRSEGPVLYPIFCVFSVPNWGNYCRGDSYLCNSSHGAATTQKRCCTIGKPVHERARLSRTFEKRLKPAKKFTGQTVKISVAIFGWAIAKPLPCLGVWRTEKWLVVRLYVCMYVCMYVCTHSRFSAHATHKIPVFCI